MGVAILIPNKIDFKLESIRRDGEGHFILITGAIYQDEVSILNNDDPNTSTPTYVKETLLELTSCIKDHTLVVGDFNNTLFTMHRSTRQKHIREITDVMIQMDLRDFYRKFTQTQKNKPSFQHLMEPSQN